MLSVIIPTEGAEHPAVATLAALVAGAASGVVAEVLLVDRGGSQVIERVADVAGCRYLAVTGSRGEILASGARQARSPWLMFLHAGAVPDPGWVDEAMRFMRQVADSGRPRAAVFRYARAPHYEPTWRDGLKFLARRIAGPFPDQGLLIARDHYERLGGHAPNAARAEAQLLRQLGRSSLALLRSRVVMV
ncbi:MAG TPA: glycosyl transferase [Bradyrhizobium sp.]|nr:glycosyl transferase [Bradyrhizobium sp.]